MAALRDPWDPETRLAAALALAQWLSGAVAQPEQITAVLAEQLELVENLIQALGDRHKGVQVHAAECLEVLAHFSAEVLPALQRTLAATDHWQAWGAAIVLARLGIWNPQVGSALVGAMGSHNRDLRWAAANLVLRLAEQQGRPLVELCVAAVEDPEPVRRKMLAYLLGEMGRRGYTDSEPALFPLLSDPERDVRRAAVLALDRQGGLSPRAREQLQALAAADPDEFVRRTAAGVMDKHAR